MKIIITESQLNLLLEASPLASDNEFRDTIKSFENEVVDGSGKHYVFDDKDPKDPKTFVSSPSKKRGGTLTIGWGHTGPEAKIGAKITNTKAEQLLTSDINNEEKKTKNLFPKYDSYPLYVRRALVNSVYRGEAKKGYEWVNDINAGKWETAATKYLQGWDIDFSQANDPKYKGGVADRMVTNQEAFKQYANELKGGKTPTTDKKPNNNSGETEKQRCLKMTPLDAAKRPECDKYFKSDYNMDYGYDFSKEFYIVKPGDTLSKIASKYDKTVTVETIKKLNNLKSDNIEVGQKLKIK
jgi:GH24 family phage-related lysozyme (muramidase)